MTTQTSTVFDLDQDVRWRQWQARGAAHDRRTAMRMRMVLLFIALALAAWFYMQLA